VKRRGEKDEIDETKAETDEKKGRTNETVSSISSPFHLSKLRK
jgi:hypothetical protein